MTITLGDFMKPSLSTRRDNPASSNEPGSHIVWGSSASMAQMAADVEPSRRGKMSR